MLPEIPRGSASQKIFPLGVLSFTGALPPDVEYSVHIDYQDKHERDNYIPKSQLIKLPHMHGIYFIRIPIFADLGYVVRIYVNILNL